MSRTQITPNFFADTGTTDQRLSNLERTVQTLGPQDQGAAFAAIRNIASTTSLGGPSIQKAAVPTDYDLTTPAVQNGVTPLLVSSGTALNIVYAPTRNAWWFVIAQVAIDLPGSGRFGISLALSPADTDTEFAATALVTGTGWATATVSKMFSILGSEVGSMVSSETYTASAYLVNLDDVGGATYECDPQYTFMWASALPNPS